MIELWRREFGIFDNVMTNSNESYSMRTNIEETKDDYKFFIELPGFDKKDIKISLDEGVLKVVATMDETKEDKERNYIRKEIKAGSYERRFKVGNVNIDDMNATLENGILKIIIPKEEKKYLEIK